MDRNEFLVQLDDATRTLDLPEDISQTAALLLGQHLKVNRCAYADVESDQDTFNLSGDYNHEVESIVGRYTFTQFGAECLRQVRAQRDQPYHNIPALALTAYVRTEDRLRAIRAGFHMHVNKPVEAVELVTMVSSLSRRRAGSSEP